MPDLSGLAFLLAAVLLVAGTVAVCFALALAARVVDRVWDRLAPDEDEQRRPVSARTTSARLGALRSARLSRQVQAALLTGALLAALAWLSFTLARLRDAI